MSVFAVLAIYLLGGLTFIPLVLSIAFLHAYLTQPPWIESDSDGDSTSKTGDLPGGDGKLGSADFDGLPSELKTRTHVPDVAAGYFAVCREYVPGGINGKPPERTTPAGAVVAAESPSVYQSMYRTIFDRNKTTSPTIEATNNKSKKARNVFYVVLRLGHLMLYDDSEQLEVRHVISLAHYDVDIYGGGEAIPEGELWIKRNCIRLVSRRQQPADILSESRKPFYLFSENCSEKEDFYHAMLQSQEYRAGSDQPQLVPLKFDTPDLVKLVQQLHADEENLNTRWINALFGRLFLSLYKTKDVENFIWTKMTKKISRVPKPALISSINLVKVDMGTLPPFVTNPKLKELTVDGDLIIEADVSYKGNFRVEISAIARIDLGTRFKAREVTLVLATSLKKLDGHILVRIKPPPSNRVWVTFENAPKMELVLEPIVSSRQITYGVILRAIESRLREVVSETLVYPNWDDLPFSDTIANQLRGGIWSDSSKDTSGRPLASTIEEEVANKDGGKDSDPEDFEITTPIAVAPVDSPRISRKGTTSSADNLDAHTTGYSSAIDKTPTKPKAMRSGSFATVANPVVDLSPTVASATKSDPNIDAAATMKTTISRSQPSSPAESPVGSLEKPSSIRSRGRGSTSSADLRSDQSDERHQGEPASTLQSSATLPAISSATAETFDQILGTAASHSRARNVSSTSLPRNNFASADKRQMLNQSFNTATAAAKKWFASKQNQDTPASPKPSSSRESLRPTDEPSQENDKDSASATGSLSAQQSDAHAPLGSPAHPIGRGQPLPPPGTPLPGPQKPEKRNTGWSVPTAATFANLAKRKPVAGKPNTNPQSQSQTSSQPSDPSPPPSKEPSSPPAPPLPARPPVVPTPSYPTHSHSHSHERTTSVGTAAMGIRRKSNSTSNHTPSFSSQTSGSSRRQRRSVTDAAIRNGHGNGGGNGNGESGGSPAGIGSNEDGLFVVEAPILDVSAPVSPVAIEHNREAKELGYKGNANAATGVSRNEDIEAGNGSVSVRRKSSMEEGVFPGMEGVS